MRENSDKRDKLERAKDIMRTIDPALLSTALNEMIQEADEAEEADVQKIKDALRGIYESIPEGKNKSSILSKAIEELDSDVIEREVNSIKESLAEIDTQTILQAAKDFVDIEDMSISCPLYLVGCKIYIIKPCSFCIKYEINPCLRCIKYIIFPPCSHYCIKYAIFEYPEEWEVNPLIKEQLKEEIIQDLLQRPELSRAMKKMLREMQDER